MKLHIFRTHRQNELQVDLHNGMIIGTAHHCDLQFNDRHMSYVHARVIEENGRFWLVDADSDNGIRNRFGISMGGKIELQPGVRFDLGEHAFEVHDEVSPVDYAAQPLPPSLMITLPVALALLGILTGINMFESYLQTPVEDFHMWPTFRNLLFEQTPLFVVAGVAYLVGVLLRGRGYFTQILALCLAVSALRELLSFAVLWFNYNLGTSVVLDAIEFSIDLGIMLFALYLGLKWVSHWTKPRLVSACVLFFSMVIVNAYIDLVESSSNDANLREYNERLFNSEWRFVRAQSHEDWRGSVDALFDRVEQQTESSEVNEGSEVTEPEH